MISKQTIDSLISEYLVENETGNITAVQINELFRALTNTIYEISDRVTVLENGGGSSQAVITLVGSLIYSETSSTGGNAVPVNTLKITKDGIEQNVTFNFSIPSSVSSIASINSSTGTLTFQTNNSTSPRGVLVTASCTFEGQTYTTTATAIQIGKEQAQDVIVLSGDLVYGSSVAANGGTVTPNSTLQLLVNNVAQTVNFTYTSNQSYASVNSSTGAVTFSANSGNARSATITAKCTYNGVDYTKTATVNQNAYVAPVTYTITRNLTGMVSSNTTTNSVTSGGSYTTTLSVSNGYENPQVTVTMGGTNITSSAYNSITGVVSISAVTGNIVITGTASQIQVQTYNVTLNLTGVEASNTATTIAQGESYSNTLSAITGYGPTFHLTVTQGGLTLVDQDFSGSEPITIQSVSGDIVITAVATQAGVKSIYGGGALSRESTVSVSDFVVDTTVNASTKSITFNVDGQNHIIVIAPSELTLVSCQHVDEITEDVTVDFQSSVQTVTYGGETMKMYQLWSRAGKQYDTTYVATFD